MERLQNHLTGQHQLLESIRHQLIVRAIPINRQAPKIIEQIQLIDSLRNQLSSTISITRQSLTSLARTIPINSQLRNFAVGAIVQ